MMTMRLSFKRFTLYLAILITTVTYPFRYFGNTVQQNITWNGCSWLTFNTDSAYLSPSSSLYFVLFQHDAPQILENRKKY